MILNHLMGLYTHPKQEWHAIEQNHEALKSSLSHVLLIALIPAVCSFIATAYIGWNPGAGDPIYLTPQSAMFMSVGMYFGLIAGVFALAYLAFWMAKTFDAQPTFTQALELASYLRQFYGHSRFSALGWINGHQCYPLEHWLWSYVPIRD